MCLFPAPQCCRAWSWEWMWTATKRSLLRPFLLCCCCYSSTLSWTTSTRYLQVVPSCLLHPALEQLLLYQPIRTRPWLLNPLKLYMNVLRHWKKEGKVSMSMLFVLLFLLVLVWIHGSAPGICQLHPFDPKVLQSKHHVLYHRQEQVMGNREQEGVVWPDGKAPRLSLPPSPFS